jgi:magnesium-transporting ATPase (P-type)
MDEDVYRTPQSDLTTLDERRGSAVKAILVATVVDVTATIVVGVVITMVYGVMLAVNGASQEVITSKLSDLDLTSNVSLAILLSGSLFTIFAGFLCAKLVNHSEYKIVTIFAIILTILGLAMGLAYYSIVENVILALITLGCVYFGAWLYVSKKRRLA